MLKTGLWLLVFVVNIYGQTEIDSLYINKIKDTSLLEEIKYIQAEMEKGTVYWTINENLKNIQLDIYYRFKCSIRLSKYWAKSELKFWGCEIIKSYDHDCLVWLPVEHLDKILQIDEVLHISERIRMSGTRLGRTR